MPWQQHTKQHVSESSGQENNLFIEKCVSSCWVWHPTDRQISPLGVLGRDLGLGLGDVSMEKNAH